MPKRRMLIVAIGVLAISFAAGLLWFDSHFEEPDAKHIESIAEETGARSVLAVFAHPDDEQLITGLLIRAKERDGATTRIITATKGEAGTPLPQISRIGELGIIRHAELLKNGYALGVKEQLVWDYPDGGLADADFNEYVERIQAQMQLWKPDLVVTFWPESGFSDHPDHKTAGRAAAEAVNRQRIADPTTAPRAMAYILAPRAMMERFAGETGKKIAKNQPDPTHAMPGEAWAKIRGWDIHQSQSDFVQQVYGFPPWIIHRLYNNEHYHVIELE